MKIEKLENAKPCPFCGGTDIFAQEYDHGCGQERWRVLCAACMAMVDTGYWQSKWRAVDAWERRV